MTTKDESSVVRPPIDVIRETFAECDALMARLDETKKQNDLRAWKRKGGVLEVVCVGHMRKCLDYIEHLEARTASTAALVEAATRLLAAEAKYKMTGAEKIIAGISDDALRTEGIAAMNALRAALSQEQGNG